MSNTVTLFIIDENSIPRIFKETSYLEKYRRLVLLVQDFGARWGTIELRLKIFAKALEYIDSQIHGGGMLPVLSLNNSPHNLLGNDSDCPAFGYFSPNQVRDLGHCIRSMPITIDKGAMVDREIIEYVLDVYQSCIFEAARRKHAIAIVHS